jgi:glutathione synthase/RimK-type ligase-like ATP-grasp enzyme
MIEIQKISLRFCGKSQAFLLQKYVEAVVVDDDVVVVVVVVVVVCFLLL